MKIKPCPVCGKPPEITIGAEGKTASCVNKKCWLFGIYVLIRRWNRRAAAHELSDVEWEKLAMEAREASYKECPENPEYPHVAWSKTNPWLRIRYIAFAKFIARKLK